MKGDNRSINLLLLISMLGVLTLTAHEYVVCQSDLPDEFLELAVTFQRPTLPVFAPLLNNHPSLIRPLKTFSFLRTDLRATSLRC